MNNSKMRDLQPIILPEPVFEGSETVFEALKNRKTSRKISPKAIPLQILADILWAAQGVNRVEGPFGGPGRTAGSASNSQEILIYTAMEECTYLYDPDPHMLVPVVEGDIRPLATGQGQENSGQEAPVRLIYVVDIDKFQSAGFQEPGLYNAEIQKSYYFVDTGLIAQNVYLACTALGLSAWFHNCDKAALKKKLRLNSHQRVLFGQTVGYTED